MGRRLLGVLAGLVAAGAAAAAEDTPEALLERAFANLYADDYVQTLDLATQAPSMRSLVRTLQITRKQSVKPGKALVRFLEPFDVRRTSVLILENDGSSDDLFVYLPAIGMTRRISAAQRADSFFGTDLSYEDIEPKRASDYVVRHLPEDGMRPDSCMPLEVLAIDGFESTYEKMVSCVEPARAIIYWTEFHRHGRPIKRLEIDLKDVREIGERFIPFTMTVRTLRTGSETVVRTHSYELTGEIPERLFSTWNLEAGDADRDRSKAGAGRAAD